MASGTEEVTELAGYVVTNGLAIIAVVIGVGAIFFLIRLGWRRLRGSI